MQPLCMILGSLSEITQYSFTENNKGAGATIVVILVVFIMIITFILQKIEKKFVYHP